MKPEHADSIVFIVDDDPTNVHVLIDALSHVDLNVSVATSGEAALKLVEVVKPDIILLDVIMPGIDGFETCRRLKENEAVAEIPVIFMTALSETVNKIAGFEAGGVDYITKPFQHEEVLARVNAHLTIRQQQRQLRELNAGLAAERELLAERVQEQTAKLRETNTQLSQALRLKDEFLRSMSHEFRTPLNIILGMSEALQQSLYGPLNDEQRKSLCSIEENGQRLLVLLIDILEFSKIMAGTVALEIRSIPLTSVCHIALQRIDLKARKKHIRVSSRLDTGITKVQADETRLGQILDKLLDNAVKFTPEGGMIGLEVTGDSEQHMVRFTVWDTGIGIADDDMGRMFQTFVQLDGSLSRGYDGVGIGLSLTRHLVDMHGGRITVESEPGKGSRFTVSLPWKEAATP